MDILIRDVDPPVVKKIDELAKKSGLKSRQEFLKVYLTNLSVVDEMNNLQRQFEQLQKQTLSVLNQNTNVMNRMIKIIEEIIDEDDGV
ncbi:MULTISPECIES: ribbon-helix-helix protein, CopG family [Bacillus subtilis group]|uniref:ribbon-helix-helix protein, CopG family n=1 Tax=Bacillus subtilis group TaxID=653685 RepID=UPI000BA7186F|nr:MULTISPECIES: ribbon-helix-helix protein, CopG family [Bacillus subtilis group]MDE1385726.1 ribbon-helix-helix protein, CopG family [Bacillus paralicheniformis]MDE1418958.1 ribbon-helix-helix protein, CopG family [Bacillus licheniformis]PAE47594.1 hypothetical protein CHH95_20305 [Bacillus licheniformis]PDH71252.1 hypothetical protein TY90_16080 [Bacillus licheniformis]TWJ43973.1 hypothetical protein CHCC5026_1768 [Bacillus licheniformis]